MKIAMTFFALLFALGAAPAVAAEYAGVVKTVRGKAAVERAGVSGGVSPGTQIREGDRVVTGGDGYVGITMRDDTMLTLGPNTAIVIDRYAFDERTHDGNSVTSMLKGMLYVVTGLIARRSPDSFAVRTKVSTLGVRGTEFIVEVREN